MEHEEVTLKYQVEFNQPEFNAQYTFMRHGSGAFAYGNGTAVTVLRNGQRCHIFDTRYDPDVVQDFKGWCESWLSKAFDPAYQPRFMEVTQ